MIQSETPASANLGLWNDAGSVRSVLVLANRALGCALPGAHRCRIAGIYRRHLSDDVSDDCDVKSYTNLNIAISVAITAVLKSHKCHNHTAVHTYRFTLCFFLSRMPGRFPKSTAARQARKVRQLLWMRFSLGKCWIDWGPAR